MVIYHHTTESIRGRTTEGMDEVNYIDSYNESMHNEDIFRGGNRNSSAYGGSFSGIMTNFGVSSGQNSGMRTSRVNSGAARRRVRSSRGTLTTGLDVSSRSPGHSEVYNGTDAAVVHQSGLEGYGRYLGIPGATECYDDAVFDGMDSSEYPEQSINNYQGSHGAELSLPLHIMDGGLESYGRYLGSSSMPEDCESTVHNGDGNFRLNRESGSRGGLDYFREALSGYEGLGSYGQPYIESGDVELSRNHTTENMNTCSNEFSNGHRY